MTLKYAPTLDPVPDPYEAQVRAMLKRVIPRASRRAIAKALSEKVRRNITPKRLDNLIAAHKQTPRMSLSTAKALCEVLSATAGADAASLRRYLNNDEDLALIQIGEHARANRKLLAQIATPKAKSRFFEENPKAAALAAYLYLEQRQSVQSAYEAIRRDRESLGLELHETPGYMTVHRFLNSRFRGRREKR